MYTTGWINNFLRYFHYQTDPNAANLLVYSPYLDKGQHVKTSNGQMEIDQINSFCKSNYDPNDFLKPELVVITQDYSYLLKQAEMH